MDSQNKAKKTEKPDFYANFVQKLQQNKSSSIRNSFVNFIKDIQKDRRDILDLVDAVNDFRENFEVQFQDIWNEDEETEEQNGEAIEGLITKNLYDKLVGLYPLQRDKTLAKLFYVYSFIEPKHLEIPEGIITDSVLQHAITQINKIEKYKTPRDKVISIINACKIISTMVQQAQKNTNKLTGADDFLPTLIYTVIKAKPTNATCDLSFIRDLRSTRRLRGMEEYYFTAYESAIHFVENLEKSQLKMDKDEFERLVTENTEKYTKETSEILETRMQDVNKENLEPSQEGTIIKSDSDLYQSDNLKAIAEDIAESMQENYKEILKKMQELKEFGNFDPKSQKYYNKNPRDLTIGEIDGLVGDFNSMCNLHREVSRKIEELNNLVEEKINPKKKQERSLFKLFKLT